MAENEVSSEAVVVLPYKDDRNQGNTYIVQVVKCEYGQIVEAVPCEDDKGYKNVISDMDEQALTFEEGDMKVRREKTIYALVEAVLYEYDEGAKN